MAPFTCWMYATPRVARTIKINTHTQYQAGSPASRERRFCFFLNVSPVSLTLLKVSNSLLESLFKAKRLAVIGNALRLLLSNAVFFSFSLNNLKNFKNVEHVNSFGYYIGNYPSLKLSKINKICEILNKIKF